MVEVENLCKAVAEHATGSSVSPLRIEQQLHNLHFNSQYRGNLIMNTKCNK